MKKATSAPSGVPCPLLRSLIAILLSVIRLQAQQADYEYVTNNGQITITKYIGPGGAVQIPFSIDGFPVTRIGASCFESNSTVTSVILPEGIVDIGEKAFRLCNRMTNATLPKSVSNIGAMGFISCWALRSITLPDGITAIADHTFGYCLRVCPKTRES